MTTTPPTMPSINPRLFFQGGAPGAGMMRGPMAEIMQNPDARAEVEAKRKSDPDLFRDPEKRRAFFQQLMEKYGKK